MFLKLLLFFFGLGINKSFPVLKLDPRSQELGTSFVFVKSFPSRIRNLRAVGNGYSVRCRAGDSVEVS